VGLAVATRFADSGADVAIVARGREGLDAALATIGASARGRLLAVQGDVALMPDVQRAYDETMAAFGKIDIVVNNAGVSRNAPSSRSPTRSGGRISTRSCSPPSG
jgi:NAD(P)-dependent dehydrogenase (short-subunit alcohol dehydrogenase family)